MRRFELTIAVCLSMALLVPYTDKLAVYGTSPAYTHYLYVMGHAGWLHYAVNVWTLLALHNLFRWYRMATAYALAVIIGYVMLPELPMVGASVITCFFIGFATPYFWRKSRLSVFMTIALLAMTCILPGFAGVQHVVMYVAGFAFSWAESAVHSLRRYIRE